MAFRAQGPQGGYAPLPQNPPSAAASTNGNTGLDGLVDSGSSPQQTATLLVPNSASATGATTVTFASGTTGTGLSNVSPSIAPQKLKGNLPKRTTKTSQKLKLFPEGVVENLAGNGADPVGGETVSDRPPVPILPHISSSEPKDAVFLNKLERKWLPRVTGYCTANAYKMDDLFEDLKKKSATHGTQARRYDEGISPGMQEASVGIDFFAPRTTSASERTRPTTQSGSHTESNPFFLQNIDSFGQEIPANVPFGSLAKRIAPAGECLFFDYGVVVLWGLTEAEEKKMLEYLHTFEEETLDPDDIETEEFHFHYNAFCQPRIYNDVITLKNPSNYMIKLTISHSIAQSCKLALFEGLMEETIESTKHVPQIMAEEGKIRMSRHAINKKIGTLFIMRINVNLVSNVLDTPEIFWSEPALEPLYGAIRGYLEISQRVELLNQRVSVISDLLDMLKEHLNSSHGEQLEWIVIILIAFEILIGIITISFDLTTYLQHDGR